MKNFWEHASLALIGAALISFLILLWCWVGGRGQPDYCYIKTTEVRDSTGNTYRHFVVQHRNWTSDEAFGPYETPDEAIEAMGKIECSIRGAKK